ncbi:nucleoside/nucleotide kinase family protein [Tessaracoccus sp. OS52]|uniref:nucleoside/nucleotide kinase family protein n=1 Tax=Tessaracoccus sp. OS52 TaxID=2886691 RepID=UPI001D111C18|nr:nucleoside/nucleotide kinase family protein [Tessaracoccus sp. OS52]MCC2593914.1 nucleoside/nucleotide kinase family protein [Tessaracoccus sp. OS52]
MEQVADAALADLIGRAEVLAASPSRKLLGIVGAPGAGKSTVAGAIVEALGERAVLVPMDGFHLDNPVLEALGSRHRKGAPDTFDVEGYVALLRRLRAADHTVHAPRFDRSLELAIGSAIPVPPGIPLVVTEGNYLLLEEGGWEAVRPELDEVWYLDVASPELRRRLVSRRMAHGETRQAARAWVESVDEANAAVVELSRERADLRVRVTG